MSAVCPNCGMGDCIAWLTAGSDAIATCASNHVAPVEQPTLRDRFAMAALACVEVMNGVSENALIHNRRVVECAYSIADLMLAERAKGAK